MAMVVDVMSKTAGIKTHHVNHMTQMQRTRYAWSTRNTMVAPPHACRGYIGWWG